MEENTQPDPPKTSIPGKQPPKRVSRFRDSFATPEGEAIWAQAEKEATERREAANIAEADRRIAEAENEALERRHHEETLQRVSKARRQLRQPEHDEIERRIVDTPFSAIEPKPMEYLWYPWFPLRVLGLFGADKAIGKSSVMLDCIARATTGSPWPDGTENTWGPTDCVVVCEEDDPERVIRPRLDAAGADTSRVHLLEVQWGNDDDSRGLPRFPLDTDIVERFIVEKKAKLVLLDLLMDCLQFDPRENAYQNTRDVAGYVAKLASRTECCIIGTDHLTKGNPGNAKHRMQGSIGLTSRAKITLFAAPSRTNEGHAVFGIGDINYAPKPEPLAYYIAPHEGSSKVVWDGVSSEKIDDLLGPTGGTSEKKETCREWLIRFLEAPRLRSEVLEESKWDETVVFKAAKHLHVASAETPEGILWALPDLF